MAEFNLKLVIQAIDKISAPARKMGRAIGAIGKRHGLDKLGKSIGGVGRQLGKVGKEAWNFGKSMVKAAASASVVFFTLLKKTATLADGAVKTADKLGIAVEQLQRMRYAAELNGIAIRTHDVALQRFIRRTSEAAEGTGEAKDALKEMSIELRDNNGVMRPTEQLLADVAGALQKIEDPAKRVRLAFKLFDSEGVDMVRMLSGGKDAMKKMYKEADRLGIATEAQSRLAERFNDNLFRLWTTIRNMAMSIAFELMPEVDNFLVYLRELTVAARPQILQGLKDIFEELGVVVGWVKTVWNGLTSGLTAFNKALFIVAPFLGVFTNRMSAVAAELGWVAGGVRLVAGLLGLKLVAAVFGMIVPLYNLASALLGAALNVAKLAYGIMGGLMKAMYAAAPAIWAAVKATLSFTAALLTNPLTWIVLGIVALVAAAWLLVKNWKKVAVVIEGVWLLIRDSAMETIQGLIDWFNGLDMVKVGKDWIGGMIDGIREEWLKFSSWFVEKAQAVAGFFGGGVNAKLPATPAGTSGSALPRGGQAQVGGSIKVDFSNLPQGARVTHARDTKSDVGLDVDAGYNMAMP